MVATLTVAEGALTQAPCWQTHQRSRNWCATICRDAKVSGGLRRDFWKRVGGDFYYVVPDDLKPGIALEFGADYYSAGGKVTRNRMWFVVTNVQPNLLTLQEYATASKACKAAREFGKTMKEDEYIKLSELGDEYWTEFSKLIADKMKKCPPHLRDTFLAMLQDKSSVYGSKFDAYMDDS